MSADNRSSTASELQAGRQRLTQYYNQRHGEFLNAQFLNAPEPSVHEYSLLNAFSWIKSYDEYLEQGETGPDTYLADVSKDTNFFNPSCVDVMAEAYHIDDEFISTSDCLRDMISRNTWTMEECVQKVKLNRSDARLRKGVALTRNEKYGEAITQLTDAIQIYPTADAFVARGAAYANIGAFVLAVDDFRDAIKLDPNHVNAQTYLTSVAEKVLNRNIPATSLSSDFLLVDDKATFGNGSKETEASVTDPKRTSLPVGKISESISRLKEFLSGDDLSRDSESSRAESEVSRSKNKKRRRDEKTQKKDIKKKDKSLKKEKKKKKSKHKKSSKRRSKTDTPIMSSSSDSKSSGDEEVLHPILQRQSHKLWG